MKCSLSCLVFLLILTLSWTQEIGLNHNLSGDYAPIEQESWQRASYDLGSSFQNGTASFALYSQNATRVLLEIYEKPYGEAAKYDYWMQKGSDNIWRVQITVSADVVYYAFRLWGANWPYSEQWQRGNSEAGFISDVDSMGNRFNPNKVLYDPYALEMSHDKSNPKVMTNGHNPGMFGSGSGLYQGVARRNFDTGKWSPKGILFRNAGTAPANKPNIAQKDSIIYEAHVRGITNHPSASRLTSILSGIPGMENVVNVPAEYRGTYKGAGYLAKYLKALGINVIELLPVHETDNDANPPDSPGGNYWGYATFSYFAPDRRYAYDKSPGGPTREFKEMVKAFHKEGIEVYLDVVYNHTGEGGTWEASGKSADMLCFRGIDNAQYYALPKGVPHSYWDSTGCGNNLNCASPVVKKMVLDSLVYWIKEMGLSGFRFDLATVLGRDIMPNYDFNGHADLLKSISQLQGEYDVEMIAEAWDCQWPGGYQVGNFPYGWGEWNGQYRDGVRRFIKGGGVSTGFTDFFNGSYSLYADQGGPQKSVNFLVAHDGFTLMDLLSYNSKNNANPWPFGPSDGGSDNNDSWDHAGNQTLRRQQLRNLWTIQMFSRGVPMVVWGDEFARTQNGNNNPYNVDSVATWSNYDMIKTDSPHLVSTGAGGTYHNNFGTDSKKDGINSLFLFAKELLHLRKQHPCLRQDSYHVPYIFTKADGNTLQSYDRAVKIHIKGSSAGDSDFLVLINTWTEKVDFTIPATGKKWFRILDTSDWAEPQSNFWKQDQAAIANVYSVFPWSVVVLEEKN